jgi:predicted small lipoprotein YifL
MKAMLRFLAAAVVLAWLAGCGDEGPSKPSMIQDNDRVREAEQRASRSIFGR